MFGGILSKVSDSVSDYANSTPTPTTGGGLFSGFKAKLPEQSSGGGLFSGTTAKIPGPARVFAPAPVAEEVADKEPLAPIEPPKYTSAPPAKTGGGIFSGLGTAINSMDVSDYKLPTSGGGIFNQMGTVQAPSPAPSSGGGMQSPSEIAQGNEPQAAGGMFLPSFIKGLDMPLETGTAPEASRSPSFFPQLSGLFGPTNFADDRKMFAAFPNLFRSLF